MKARTLVLTVVLLALFAASSVFAQTTPLYIKQFGSAQIDYIKGVVTDEAGNVYVAGYTHGNASEDTLASPLPSKGGADIFVARFDASGNLSWMIQFGSPADDFASGIALDEQNGVVSLYVAGSTKGTMPVGIEQDPVSRANASAGLSDAFVAKIHADSGIIRWIEQFGTPADDEANGVATDTSGMIYVVGSTRGAIDGMTQTGGTRYAYIRQFVPTGATMRTLQFCATQDLLDTEALAVAVYKPEMKSATNYIYITGSAEGTDKSPLFVTRTDPWFEQLRTVTLGGSVKDIGRAVSVDSRGNVIVAGSTQGAFDGSTWQGAEDIIVIKFSLGLTKLWSLQYGTDSNDLACGVAVDAANSIYLTGITGYPSTGRGLEGQTHVGDYDIFLTRLATEDGRRVFTRQLGTSARDLVYGVAIDPSGNVFVAGATDGIMAGHSYGSTDAVLIKYGPDGPVPPPVTEFFINGTVQEFPQGTGLDGVSITVKDELGQAVGDYTTDSAGRFASKVAKAGKYFVHKLKIGYRAQVDPDVVEVSQAVPSIAPVAYMEKIVVPTAMAFRKGYNSVRFDKLPAGNHSVDAVFGPFAGNPYVGLIFSFDRPMQFLILAKPRTAGNLKTIEFGRSYMIYTSRAFTLNTTSWVNQPAVPSTALPGAKVRGKIQPY